MSMHCMFETLRYLSMAGLDRCLPRRRIRFLGNYTSWPAAAAAARGYDDTAILETVRTATRAVLDGRAAFERDGVLFRQPEYHWPLLTMLFRQQAEKPGMVTVMDFGGALGSTYHQHRHWLADLPGLRWCVVEQPGFAACGKQEFETATLKFYTTAEECLQAERVTLALFSSVLQYLPDPWSPLTQAAAADVRCVLIDRTPVQTKATPSDRWVVQHVPESIYRASYPLRIFGAEKFSALLGSGYRMVADWASCDQPVVLCRPWQVAHFHGYAWEQVACAGS